MKRDSFFYFIYAIKNSTRKKARFLSVLVTLSILFVFFVVLFQTNGLLRDAQKQKLVERYHSFDVKISTNTNSSTRYFSLHEMDEWIPTNELICKASFLTLPISDERGIYRLSLGDLNEFRNLVSIKSPNLNPDEIIVTKGLMEKWNLGSTLTISFLGLKKTYQIREAITDGFFTGERVFMSMDSFSSFLEDEALTYILADSRSEIYLKMKKNWNALTLNTEVVKHGLDIEDLSSSELVKKDTDLLNASLSVVFVFIILIIFVVLNSIIRRIILEKKSERAVLSFLGASKHLFVKLVFYEFIFDMLCAIGLGLLVSPLILFILGRVFTSSFSLHLEALPFLYAILFLFFLTSFSLAIQIFWTRKEKKELEIDLFPRFCGLLAVYLVSLVIRPYYVSGILSIIILLMMGFTLIKILFLGIKKVFKDKTTFALFNLKHMVGNKTYFQSIKILFMTFLGMMSIFSVKNFVNHSVKENMDNLYFDQYLMNIYDYNQNLKNVIEANSTLEKECSFYSKIELVEYNYEVDFAYAMDSSNYETMFGFKGNKEVISKLDFEEPLIFLNESFPYFKGSKEGEVISIDLKDGRGQQEVKIGGFIDFGIGNICFLSKGLMNKVNCVCIKGGTKDLYNALEPYTNQMFLLVEVSDYYHGYVSSSLSMTRFISILTLIILSLLYLVIVNNAFLFFEEMKQDYAKLSILGMGLKEFSKSIFLESVIAILVTSLVSFILTPLMFKGVSFLMVLINSYYALKVNGWGLLYGFLLGSMGYFLSMSVFIIEMKKMELSKVVNEI